MVLDLLNMAMEAVLLWYVVVTIVIAEITINCKVVTIDYHSFMQQGPGLQSLNASKELGTTNIFL